jgi:hypothetical protein
MEREKDGMNRGEEKRGVGESWYRERTSEIKMLREYQHQYGEKNGWMCSRGAGRGEGRRRVEKTWSTAGTHLYTIYFSVLTEEFE